MKSLVKSELVFFPFNMARLLLLSDSNFVNNIGDYKGRKIKGL